jgi:hypothetical protein
MQVVAKIVRLILASMAWVLFAIWWTRVTRPSWTPQWEIDRALIVIGSVGIALLAFSFLWINHNKRLAKKGRRGKVSNYVFFKREQDSLGRPLLIQFERMEWAPNVIVEVLEETKYFRLSDPAAEGLAGAD